ncbi:Two component signal transduction histidine-protein kinase [Modestobacter italicus]|uniref:Two component signal transduction histidine-protein kinase n=1 Tax=Modestobacter italicus (strain DSM 44449 / CECT 9708 / BC 501) TaxID=2732864 RepID=I4F0D4_MODI5|nr:ATP-binding protein [Modestobacter marinus]CCH89097.1 Two component signal transduction histidine-protein kinase [Modestobacter marinus]
MTSDLPEAWPLQPPPDTSGAAQTWRWQISKPAQLTAARNQLREALGVVAIPASADQDDIDRLLLAFEELASNGLRHGGPPVRVTVADGENGWLIDVDDDRVDHAPLPAVDRDPALGGLGLPLISRLSEEVGWAVVGSRKHVWARLRATPSEA